MESTSISMFVSDTSNRQVSMVLVCKIRMILAVRTYPVFILTYERKWCSAEPCSDQMGVNPWSAHNLRIIAGGEAGLTICHLDRR